jgi:predicted nucleic acid-binding protein
LTLFRARRKMDQAREWAEEMDAGVADIIVASDDDVALARQIFFSFDDKQWSFVDCLSRAMMERLSIQRAFAFDEHFRQFGTVTVLP